MFLEASTFSEYSIDYYASGHEESDIHYGTTTDYRFVFRTIEPWMDQVSYMAQDSPYNLHEIRWMGKTEREN